eukprot:1957408-Amphidinium_carterae.1
MKVSHARVSLVFRLYQIGSIFEREVGTAWGSAFKPQGRSEATDRRRPQHKLPMHVVIAKQPKPTPHQAYTRNQN